MRRSILHFFKICPLSFRTKKENILQSTRTVGPIDCVFRAVCVWLQDFFSHFLKGNRESQLKKILSLILCNVLKLNIHLSIDPSLPWNRENQLSIFISGPAVPEVNVWYRFVCSNFLRKTKMTGNYHYSQGSNGPVFRLSSRIYQVAIIHLIIIEDQIQLAQLCVTRWWSCLLGQ